MIVKMENIVKKYGKQTVINNFNFEADKGECIAITGESGSGKSTILNMIGLLDKYDAGTLSLFNNSNNNSNKRKLYKDKIGYIFQNFALIDDKTVYENMKLAIHPSRKHKYSTTDIKKILSEVGLGGYDKKYVFQLSGGEQQRLAIARLFLKPCELILADEPTGSLDENNKRLVLELLGKLRSSNKTIIIVTHDREVAKWCDREVVLPKVRTRS